MVNLEPTEDREQRGASRPALVLSTSLFNALGVVLVAPHHARRRFCPPRGLCRVIERQRKGNAGRGTGNQIRMLDLEACGAKRIETAPEFMVEDALARLRAIID